jgi:hypothetical protein
MLSVKRRWTSRKATTIGAIASTEPAMTRPYSITCCPRNSAKPDDKVYMLLLVLTMSGQSRSFQLYMKWNSARVSIAGTDSRRMTLR